MTANDINERINAAASDIRKYLDKRPHAAESLDGIVMWWITLQRFEESREIVEQALNKLIAEGVVRELKGPDGASVYSKAESSA